ARERFQHARDRLATTERGKARLQTAPDRHGSLNLPDAPWRRATAAPSGFGNVNVLEPKRKAGTAIRPACCQGSFELRALETPIALARIFLDANAHWLTNFRFRGLQGEIAKPDHQCDRHSEDHSVLPISSTLR
ncbi:MAG: hypothetical protein AAF565_16970, partial [Pseudomonadota bacterium]